MKNLSMQTLLVSRLATAPRAVRTALGAVAKQQALFACLWLLVFSFTAHAANPSASTTNPALAFPDDDVNKTITLPTEPGDHKLKFRTHIGNKLVVLSYLLHLPADYADPHKKHPMLVFLHGIGECGTDLGGIYAIGPMTLLREENGNPAFAASSPFIFLGPQCPPRGETWDTEFIYKACAQLVFQTIKKTRCDVDRVYATGLSMGGVGSWCVAEEAPDLFAAIAPLSSVMWNPDDAGQLLKYVGVWSVVGVEDQSRFFEGTRQMQKSLRASAVSRRFTYLYGNGHDAWYPVYANPQFYEWLLAQRRPSPVERRKMDAGLNPPTTQSLPTAPGHYLLTFDVKIGIQPYNLDYVLYIPKGYNPAAPACPAMLFLHEQDTIGPDFHDICMHGPDLLLERKPALQNNFPFVVISPRLPLKCEWNSPGMSKALLALLDHVSESIHLDPARISVTGINIGATGAWKLVSDAPNRFAAIIPVLTSGSFTPGDDQAAVVNNLPGRAFIKTTENGSVERMTQLISKTKLDWRLSKLPGTVNALGDLPAYSDHQILNWLSQQRRKAPTSQPVDDQ